LLLVILLALVVGILFALLFGNLKAAAQTKIGPWVGLRLPVYDYACKCYRYFKLNPDQFRVDPDPIGTSDGVWSIRPEVLGTALPPTLGSPCGTGGLWSEQAGMYLCSNADGIEWTLVPMLAAPGTNPVASSMHRVWLSSGLPPVKGASCSPQDTEAAWIGRAGVFVCVPDERKLDFVWGRIAIETVP
jgi:hypothetical protein